LKGESVGASARVTYHHAPFTDVDRYGEPPSEPTTAHEPAAAQLIDEGLNPAAGATEVKDMATGVCGTPEWRSTDIAVVAGCKLAVKTPAAVQFVALQHDTV